MPMHAQEIEDLLRETFPNAEISVQGEDGVHMAAMVIDESFRVNWTKCLIRMAWLTTRTPPTRSAKPTADPLTGTPPG